MLRDGKEETLAVPGGVFSGLAFGDVHHRGVASEEIARGISHRRRRQQDREHAAIAATHFVLRALQHALFNETLQTVLDQLVTLGKEEVLKAQFAHDFVSLITQPAKFGVIDGDVDAVAIERVVTARSVVVESLRQLQRLAQMPVRFGDLHFGCPTVTDVKHLDEQPLHFTLFDIGDVLNAGVEAVPVRKLALSLITPRLARERGLQVRLPHPIVFGPGDFAQVQTQQRAGFGAHPARVAGVGKTADQVAVIERQLHRHAVGNGLEEAALGCQGGFGRVAGRDIHQRVVGVQETSVFIKDRRGAQQHPQLAAIAAIQADLNGGDGFVSDDALQAGLDRGHLVWVHEIPEAHLADDFVFGVAQPVQLGLIHADITSLRVHRVVAAGRLLVKHLRLVQGLTEVLVGFSQFLGAQQHAGFQCGVEFLDFLLVPVEIGDVPGNGHEHDGFLAVAGHRGDYGVPPLGCALEGFCEGHETAALAVGRGIQCLACEFLALAFPPRAPVGSLDLFEVIDFHQSASLRCHLHHMALQIQHFGAIRAAGDDLVAELVFDAGLHLQLPQRGDVLHEAVLGLHGPFGAQDGCVAGQHVGNAAIGMLQAEFQAQGFSVANAFCPSRLDPFEVFGMHPGKPAEILELGRGEVKDALERGVDVGQHAGRVGPEYADGKNR